MRGYPWFPAGAVIHGVGGVAVTDQPGVAPETKRKAKIADVTLCPVRLGETGRRERMAIDNRACFIGRP